MEKRILGIILSLMGVAGLIIAGIFFMKGGSGTTTIKEVIIYAVLGIIFFIAGISLVGSTKDKAT